MEHLPTLWAFRENPEKKINFCRSPRFVRAITWVLFYFIIASIRVLDQNPADSVHYYFDR